jgi:SulP family sulfate permease
MKISTEFTPKLWTLLREGITKDQLKKDILSGLIVGIVALPLAIAFGIASGVSPEKGMITAIFAGFIISAFGGSRVQIGGPTGAFIVIVYGIVQEYGVEGLTFATLIAGIMLVGMGLLRFGTLLKYIPHPLIIGFTSGIAVIIFSSQIKDFLGLNMEKVPAEFIDKWVAYAGNFNSINIYAVIIGVATILITLLTPKVTTRIPGTLLAIIACTMAVKFLHLPVETIETKFGEIPNTLPRPSFHLPDFQQIKGLISPAFAIALLGGIESLLSAVVADGMTGGRHRSNMELVAQGGANIVSSFVGGIPATGAIARTATNVKNGGRTPIAGIVHAITLLVIMLVAAPFAKLIPMSCLAGVLVIVAYNMSEWHSFKSVYKGHFYDRLVLLTVFFLTVVFDLILAIEIGMVLAAFVFMKRMSDITKVDVLGQPGEKEDLVTGLPKGVMVYEITGALFFGATQTFQDALRRTNQIPKAIILNLRNVPMIDATGMYRLEEIVREFHKQGCLVYLTEYAPSVKVEISKTEIGEMAVLHPSLAFCIGDAKEKLQTSS